MIGKPPFRFSFSAAVSVYDCRACRGTVQGLLWCEQILFIVNKMFRVALLSLELSNCWRRFAKNSIS
jgi:hypothetical protein